MAYVVNLGIVHQSSFRFLRGGELVYIYIYIYIYICGYKNRPKPTTAFKMHYIKTMRQLCWKKNNKGEVVAYWLENWT